MTPNAYTTDEVYLDFVEDYCKAIRSMPIIRDYPHWYFGVSLDGFGSHCNVHAANEIFAKYKILVVKEEGDTSHTNQAYDQDVAKRGLN